ncbi:PepSY domain-containing protein [Paracoccus aminophilus]|nr:PepSY domain-containing protein [Paracoccus aminophilus]
MKRTLSVLGLTAIASLGAMVGGQVWAATDNSAEVQQFLKAPQTLTAAIHAAESATGGKAYAAEFDDHKGTGRYEVKTLAGDKLAKVRVDATTGKVTDTKDKGLLSAKKDSDALDPAALKGSLADLVAKAETLSGGKVMSIDHERENGATTVEVEVAAADGTAKTFAFDAAGDKLVPVVSGKDDAKEHDEKSEG